MAICIFRVRRGFGIRLEKGVLILFLLLIFASNHLFAVQTTRAQIAERTSGEVYKNYLATIVPAKFVDVVYIMTESNFDLGLLVLGIAAVESDWRYMVSHHPNSDGSVDLGPLGLNSRNLEDPDFMRRFASPEYADRDPNIYYMTACINLIRGLCREYGDTHAALKVYNGGIHAASTAERWATLSQVTSLYADRVLRHYQTIEDRWDQYVHENATEPRAPADVSDERENVTEGADTGPPPVQKFAGPTGVRQNAPNRILGSHRPSSVSFHSGEPHGSDFASTVTPQPQKTTPASRGFVYSEHRVSAGHARDGPSFHFHRPVLDQGP